MTTRCANCDTEIPEGGQFCIECGAPVPQAATGATERLPEHQGGPRCAVCGTRNPVGAHFCVKCGHSLAAPAATPNASPIPPAPALEPLAAAPARQTVAAPDVGRGGRNSAAWGGISGGLFLIGLALIAWLNWWWPGILVLVGLSAIVGGVLGCRTSAQRWGGMQGGLFLIGLALIAWLNWWWPGILVLVGLSAIVGGLTRSRV
jgi:ribosomal protein L40E